MARMKVQMVRFGRRQWALIQHRAKADEITPSQYVRDSTYGMAVWSLALEAEGRGMPELAEKLRELDLAIADCFERLTGFPLPADDEEEPDEPAEDGAGLGTDATADGHQDGHHAGLPAALVRRRKRE